MNKFYSDWYEYLETLRGDVAVKREEEGKALPGVEQTQLDKFMSKLDEAHDALIDLQALVSAKEEG